MLLCGSMISMVLPPPSNSAHVWCFFLLVVAVVFLKLLCAGTRLSWKLLHSLLPFWLLVGAPFRTFWLQCFPSLWLPPPF